MPGSVVPLAMFSKYRIIGLLTPPTHSLRQRPKNDFYWELSLMIIARHKSWLASIKGSYKSICEAYMRKTSDVAVMAILAN